MTHDYSAVVDFWVEAGPERWFEKSEEFDLRFRQRFIDAHFAAARRELDHWAGSANGAFALLLLLDQFPRNAFRGSAHMYATDPLARMFARRMIDAGFDRQIASELRFFCYLPFAHSENLDDQALSVRLNEALGGESVAHARGHRDIVQRFGRFPHRNALLGRDSAPAEQAFLEAGGFAG